MKNFKLYFFTLVAFLMVTLSGCELVGDIFEAGMWTVLIIVVLVIFVLIWILRKIF